MKKLTVILAMVFHLVVASCLSACGTSVEEPFVQPASEKLQTIDTYSDAALDKYLNPIWQTTEMYDEGGVVVGETGEIRLLRKPVKNSVLKDLLLSAETDLSAVPQTFHPQEFLVLVFPEQLITIFLAPITQLVMIQL
jgi:hypothetical protein